MTTRAEYVAYLRSLEGGYGPAKGLANNDNEFNAWYYGRRVGGDAYSWCVVFECYGQNHAGILATNGGKEAYVPNMKARAGKAGAKVVTHPSSTAGMKPGDALAYDFNKTGSPEHTGTFVRAVSATEFDACEGNTETSQFSDAVALKRRNVADVEWHIELLGVDDNPPQKEDDMPNGQLAAGQNTRTNISFPHGSMKAIGLAYDNPGVAEVRIALHYKAGHGEIHTVKVGGPKSASDAWPVKTVVTFTKPTDGDWVSLTRMDAGTEPVGWDMS